ncbi:MAG TPA: hypothetical protein VI488_13585 [Candidatus Angelobacter sp.]
MARGWESKSVESQMESAQNGAGPSSPTSATEESKRSQRERQGLLLSRAYVLHQIESSSNDRYTQSLRQALSELDRKLKELKD